jgi:T-box protein 20
MATATVVTEEALLEDDELDEASAAGLDVESVATDKSANEVDDEEVDVDVEECSSVEEAPLSLAGQDKGLLKRRRSSLEEQEPEESAASGRKKRRQAQPPLCNSEELRDVECHLETKELWDKFNDLGTEMIITKTGR